MNYTLNNRLMVLLIISSVILLGNSNGGSSRVVACPQYCLEVAYVTCPSSGNQHLPSSCTNCCMTPKGCTLHFDDGTSQLC
ncbi:hypothetical protein RND81_03G161400 [Saponaria officinalis]|uniref:Uncharacterized protein n=1 Tax=Saponaria officinalis TaxID=3572 RepID=A0AAW1M7C2_SAPOF